MIWKIKALAAIILVGALLNGCATTLSLDPVPASSQELVTEGESSMVLSIEQHGVIIEPESATFSGDSGPAFIVDVENGGATGFDFSATNITASFNGQPVDVLDMEEIQAHLDSERNSAKTTKTVSDTFNTALTLLSAFAEGAQQAQTGNYVPTQQTTWYQQSQTSFAASESSYDKKITDIEARLQEASETVLSPKRVLSEESHGGVIKLTPLENGKVGGELQLTVTLPSETHVFTFNVGKQASDE